MNCSREEAANVKIAIPKSEIMITTRVQTIFPKVENFRLCHKSGIANGPTMSNITIT